MKYNISCIVILFCWTTIVVSCKKETVQTTPLASLKIVNTVTGGNRIFFNSNRTRIPRNGNADFTLKTGNPDLYIWPEGDSLHPYFHSNKTINVADNDSYTLFLGGPLTAIEGILIKEKIPYRADSTAGIRFINLSPDSAPVNVTLSTSETINEFENISYKQLTEFKSFPATSNVTNYTFQVRDAATNVVYAEITMEEGSLFTFVPRFRNVTLVFRGMVGGSPSPGITRVNHYQAY